MTDDELIAKLKRTAPKEPDPAVWASIEAGVRAGIAQPAPRRLPWRASLLGVGVAAAAGLALFLHLRAPAHLASHAVHRHVDESILLPEEDPAELVGDLDLDELQTVEHHFKGGV